LCAQWFSKGKPLAGKKTLVHCHRGYKLSIALCTRTAASPPIDFGLCNAERLALEEETDTEWETYAARYRPLFQACDKQLAELAKAGSAKSKK
jgi:hypothetical protein